MLKCFIACSGLGRVTRGFESFFQECFDAITARSEVEMFLFKGAGKNGDHERKLWNLRRSGRVAKALGDLTGRGSYYIEQASFSLGLMRQIRRHKPDVIFYSDAAVGNALWRWRRRTGQTFRLLFSNGGPVAPPFPRAEHVHQLSASHYQMALDAGETSERMTLLPYGFRLDPSTQPVTREEKLALRRQLSLPLDRPIVLSVGALNVGHKRMDYTVREIAQMASPRPFLVMLGNTEPETQQVLSEASQRLGADGFLAKMVPAAAVAAFYRAADVFVLSSLAEGFGRVYVEAASRGLPCVVHDFLVPREVLDEFGIFADLSRSGALATVLTDHLSEPVSIQRQRDQIAAMFDRYNWARLASAYVEMLKKCARAPVDGSIRV